MQQTGALASRHAHGYLARSTCEDSNTWNSFPSPPDHMVQVQAERLRVNSSRTVNLCRISRSRNVRRVCGQMLDPGAANAGVDANEAPRVSFGLSCVANRSIR